MADTIKLKAPTVEQKVVVNIQGEDKLKSFASTLDKLSRGKGLQKYWKDQQSLISDTIEAYNKFKRSANEDTSSELLKTTNALKAMGNTDISSIVPELKDIESALGRAKTLVGSLDGDFSIASFKEVFESFEALQAYGLDVKEVFSHFEVNADVSKLNNDLNNANVVIGNLKVQVDQLQDKLDESESGNGLRILKDECEDLKWELEKMRQEAEETFSVFLRSHNIDAYDFDRFFERIREGSMTAQEAIAEFKRNYAYLLDNDVSFDTSQLQDFSQRLDLVSEKITEVARKIDEISENGIKVGEVSNTENIEGLSSTLKAISEAGVSGDASAVYEALSKILTTIKEIGQIDTGNMSNLYGVIKNLSKLNDLKINKASLANLAECIERICNINNTSSLTNLSILDLTKFNDLNIRKASLKNLAEYLPQIANIDVNNLIELTKVDFSNLNNLKVDKASLETLRNFAESLRAVVQNNDQNVVINDGGNNQTSDEIAAMEKLESATKEATNAQKEFSSANDGVEGSANDSKTPLQLEAELMEQIAKSAREAADAKKEFVEANKQLKESAESSADALNNEDAKLKKDKYAKRNKISEEEFLNSSDNYASIANEGLKSSGKIILGETVNTELVNGLVRVTAKIKDVDETWKSFSARIDADGNMFEQRFKTITKGVDKLETELENFGRETAPSLSYQETLNKAQEIKEKLNLDDKFSVNVDSNEFVTITKKLSDVEGATVSVVQTFKSAEDAINHFGQEASNAAEKTKVTLKSIDQSNGNVTKEEIMSVKDAYQILINTKQEYLDLNEKKSNGTATDEEIKKLDELIAKRKQANDVVSVSAINQTAQMMNKLNINSVGDEFKTAFANASREIEKLNAELKSGSLDVDEYRKQVKSITDGLSGKSVDSLTKKISEFNKNLNSSFKTDIGIKNFHNSLNSIINDYKELISLQNKGIIPEESLTSLATTFTAMKSDMSLALDSFETKGMPADFIGKLNQARTQLDLVKASLDKVEKGEAFTKEDIANIDKYINQVRDLKNANDKLANSSRVQNLLGEIAETLNKNTAMSKELRQEFEKLSMEIKSFGDNLPADKLKEFGSRFEELKTQMKDKNQTGLSFFDGVIKKAKSMSQNFIAMYFSLYDIIRYIKNGVNVIRDLDKAFTEMRKVSDESVDSLKRFQEVSFDIANAVGTTAQQIQNSTADWMRLGESLQDAAKSAEVSNILLNVSEFESIDEATESLVAMSAAYSELDKIDIVDKLNNIGNNYSISTDGLATALQRSASALKTAGNDMDEAIALVTAGNAVVQDPDSVGAGLRTIALRITGTEAAKEELEELGEDTSDFIVQTSAKSQQAIKDFTKVASNNFEGFDILDDNGNFKSTYEILLGISQIYEEIVETDKKYGSNMANGLLETLAGKNRANIAASILQNPKLLESVYSSSQDSQGSAQEELDKYLNSIEGRIAQFQNRLQEFWYNLIDSELVKQFVDAGTDLINILDNVFSGITNSGIFNVVIGFFTELISLISKVSDGLGGLNTIIAGIGAVGLYNKIKKKSGGGRVKYVYPHSKICHRIV